MSGIMQSRANVKEWAENVLVDNYFQMDPPEGDVSPCEESRASSDAGSAERHESHHDKCSAGANPLGELPVLSRMPVQVPPITAQAEKKKEPGDNRIDLFKRFRIEVDETGRRFAAGYQWFCNRCGKPASSMETWYPCKSKFVTVMVICHLGCHNHWRLKIDNPVPENRRLN